MQVAARINDSTGLRPISAVATLLTHRCFWKHVHDRAVVARHAGGGGGGPPIEIPAGLADMLGFLLPSLSTPPAASGPAASVASRPDQTHAPRSTQGPPPSGELAAMGPSNIQPQAAQLGQQQQQQQQKQTAPRQGRSRWDKTEPPVDKAPGTHSATAAPQEPSQQAVSPAGRRRRGSGWDVVQDAPVGGGSRSPAGGTRSPAGGGRSPMASQQKRSRWEEGSPSTSAAHGLMPDGGSNHGLQQAQDDFGAASTPPRRHSRWSSGAEGGSPRGGAAGAVSGAPALQPYWAPWQQADAGPADQQADAGLAGQQAPAGGLSFSLPSASHQQPPTPQLLRPAMGQAPPPQQQQDRLKLAGRMRKLRAPHLRGPASLTKAAEPALQAATSQQPLPQAAPQQPPPDWSPPRQATPPLQAQLPAAAHALPPWERWRRQQQQQQGLAAPPGAQPPAAGSSSRGAAAAPPTAPSLAASSLDALAQQRLPPPPAGTGGAVRPPAPPGNPPDGLGAGGARDWNPPPWLAGREAAQAGAPAGARPPPVGGVLPPAPPPGPPPAAPSFPTPPQDAQPPQRLQRSKQELGIVSQPFSCMRHAFQFRRD